MASGGSRLKGASDAECALRAEHRKGLCEEARRCEGHEIQYSEKST